MSTVNFGRTASGTSNANAGANAEFVTQFTMGASALTVDRGYLRVYYSTRGTKFKAVIYADNAGTPGALVATADEVTVADAAGWYCFTFSSPPTLTANAVYWIGYHANGNLTVDVTSGSTSRSLSRTYTSGPIDPWSGGSSSTNGLSIFVQQTSDVQVSKGYALAVLGPPQAKVSVSKAYALAVIQPPLPPTVTSLDVTTGTTLGGTGVTITGTGFRTGATVTFGGTAATDVAVVNATTITCTTPAHAPGAVNVVVTNPDTQFGTLSNGYTYVWPPPIVTSLSVTEGATAGGTSLTVNGTGFQAGATVTFGGTAATVGTITSTTIAVTTPAHAAGAVDVVVTNTDAQFATLSNGFTYYPPPDVTSVAPTHGPSQGNAPLTIYGTAFRGPGATVALGGTAATNVTVVSSTEISCTTPAHAAGLVSVVVTNPDGQADTLTDSYTYDAPPAVTSLSVTSGYASGGTSLTVNGTGFVAGATVTFGGTAATVGTVTATTIAVTTPAHAAGTVDVVVTNPDGQSGTLAASYTFVPPPTITSITPANGVPAGGTSITIGGTWFLASPAVTFGGVAATSVVRVSSTVITCTAPAHALGAVDVVVTNTDGQYGTASAGFLYSPAPSPVVSTVDPSTGYVSGGATVTITGSGFQSGLTVKFGTITATVTSATATEVVAVSPPAAAAGVVTVSITNPDGQGGSLANAFTYLKDPLRITNVTPSRVPVAGGTQVTLTGTGFESPFLYLQSGGPIYTPSIVSSNATQIVFTTPPLPWGRYDAVLLQNEIVGGILFPRGARAFAFQAYGASINGVTPSTGPVAGAATVDLYGSGFEGTVTVTMGGVAATVVSITPTQVRVTSPPHAAGAVDVVLTNVSSGEVVTLAGGYTYLDPLAIRLLTPNTGTTAGGTSVTIAGTGFTANPAVTFGGVQATVTNVTSTAITVTTPAHVEGNVDVVVTLQSAVSVRRWAGFTYLVPMGAEPPYAAPKLSIPPDEGSYQFTDGATSLSVRHDGGAGRYRRGVQNAVAAFTATWTVDRAGYDYLVAFHERTGMKGLPFRVDLITTTRDLVEREARWVPGSFGLVEHAGGPDGTFRVQAQLEAKP